MFGMCNTKLHIADKNRRRVELSSSVLLKTLGKLRSLKGTELSVVVMICLLPAGSFWILTLNSRYWLIVINEVKCYEVWMFNQLWYVELQAHIYKALWIYLLPMSLTLSPVIFISIKLSLPGKNDVTYKIDRARCCWLRSNTVAF